MKLAIDERGYFFTIGWLDPEDSEFGAYLGETLSDPEHAAATAAVRKVADGRDGQRRYFWESKAHARAALQIAKLAIANLDRPMPEWAKTALSEGWKPPRGWKPEAKAERKRR